VIEAGQMFSAVTRADEEADAQPRRSQATVQSGTIPVAM
jgi:hypothetical protein